MYCQSCGKKVRENARFCNFCGAFVAEESDQEAQVTQEVQLIQKAQEAQKPQKAQEAQATMQTPAAKAQAPSEVVAAEAKPSKPGANKTLLIGGAALIIVIIAAIAAISLGGSSGGGGNYSKTDSFIYLLRLDGEVAFVTTSGEKNMFDGYRKSAGLCKALDNKRAAFEVYEDQSCADPFALYYVDGEPKMISDEANGYMLAVSGSAVVYTEEDKLKIYSGKESQRIASDIPAGTGTIGRYCISPDGKTVVYAREEDGETTAYLWDGKNDTEIGEGIEPMFVSDGGRFIYYIKNDKFYVQKGADGGKTSLGEGMRHVCFNRDMSQIAYDSGEKVYISVEGAERKELRGNYIQNILVPWRTPSLYFNTGEILYRVYGIKSFADTFYSAQNEIVHINEDFEAESVAKDITVTLYWVCDDGKTVIYLKNGSIYKIDGSKPDGEKTELVDGGVVSFTAATDGSAIFYVTEDDELYYKKGTGTPVLVSDDIDSQTYSEYELLECFYENKKLLYFTADGELYSSDGGKGTPVPGIDGEIVEGYLWTYLNFACVQAQKGDDSYYYISTDGKNFERIGIADNSYRY